MNQRLGEIFEQNAFLDYVESDLNDLAAGKLSHQNHKSVRAVVKSNLALIHDRIFKENSFWENSERLKDLERRYNELTTTVCEHSLDTGIPVEVKPGQRHTCRELAVAGAIPGECDCEPVTITLKELDDQRTTSQDTPLNPNPSTKAHT